jgi:hypothetical protein
VIRLASISRVSLRSYGPDISQHRLRAAWNQCGRTTFHAVFHGGVLADFLALTIPQIFTGDELMRCFVRDRMGSICECVAGTVARPAIHLRRCCGAWM